MEQFPANIFKSTVTKKDINALRARYQIPKSMSLRGPSESKRACSRKKYEVCLYIGSFEGGIRFPFPHIVREVLEFFGLALGQSAPNSWRHLIGCAILWSAMSNGTAPLFVEAFVHLYNLKKLPSFYGWWYFSKRDAKNLFSLDSLPQTRIGKISLYGSG